jgi:hypothetical protein
MYTALTVVYLSFCMGFPLIFLLARANKTKFPDLRVRQPVPVLLFSLGIAMLCFVEPFIPVIGQDLIPCVVRILSFLGVVPLLACVLWVRNAQFLMITRSSQAVVTMGRIVNIQHDDTTSEPTTETSLTASVRTIRWKLAALRSVGWLLLYPREAVIESKGGDTNILLAVEQLNFFMSTQGTVVLYLMMWMPFYAMNFGISFGLYFDPSDGLKGCAR